MLPMRTTTTGSGSRLAGLATSSNPFAMLDEMRREMDRVFDQVLGSWHDPLLAPTLLPRVTGAGETWMPSMDVQETEKELRLTIAVPKKAEAKKSRRVEIKGGGTLGKLLGRGNANGHGHRESQKDSTDAGTKSRERADA